MKWDEAVKGMRGRPIHLISAFVTDGEWHGINSIPDIGHLGADDLIWTINGFWKYLPNCDLGFEMHDFGGPSYEAMDDPEWYYEECLRKAKCPVFMPREDARFPQVIEYPLDEILRFYSMRPYFGESPNYCIALAGMLECPQLTLHGFGYPNGYKKQGERASTEFWLGMVKSRGTKITAIFDGNDNTRLVLTPDEWEDFYEPRMYGYRRGSA